MKRELTCNNVLASMQQIHWEQAKGHLRSILVTFWPDYDISADDGYDDAKKRIEDFITDMEKNSIWL